MRLNIVLYLIFIFSSASVLGQRVSFDSAWIKNFYRKFSAEIWIYDSCFNSYCLLKINLDGKSNVTSISLSDNADTIIKQAIKSMKDKKSLKEYLLVAAAKKKKFKNISLIYPLIVVTDNADCPDQKRNSVVDEKLFLFGNRHLSGNCMFQKSIMLITYPPVTKISPG